MKASTAGRAFLDIYDVLKEPPPWEVWTRFMAKVVMKAPHECWGWSGAYSNNGYAIFADGTKKKQYNVQRAWGVWIFGELEIRDLVMDHYTCSNAQCINPTHLLPVTTEFNNNRPGSRTVTAINLRKTACPKGHPLTLGNDGKRECKVCRKVYMTDRWHAQKMLVNAGQIMPDIEIKKTHCDEGHELSGDNLVASELPYGRRVCRICRNAYMAKRSLANYYKKKEAGLIVPAPERTHCDQGHELTPDNCVPYELSRGTKTCLLCNREKSRLRHAREREAKVALPPVPRKPKTKKTHCKQGHAFLPDNYLTCDLEKYNRMVCKICHGAKMKAYKQRVKENNG